MYVCVCACALVLDLETTRFYYLDEISMDEMGFERPEISRFCC